MQRAIAEPAPRDEARHSAMEGSVGVTKSAPGDAQKQERPGIAAGAFEFSLTRSERYAARALRLAAGLRLATGALRARALGAGLATPNLASTGCRRVSRSDFTEP